MALNNQHHQKAQEIDRVVRKIIDEDGGDEEILMGTLNYMNDFKDIMDNSGVGEMNALCSQYAGFYCFAHLLERIAGGIQNGTIEVPDK